MCVPRDGAQGCDTMDCTGMLGGRDAVGSAMPQGTSSDANLQEEAPRGRIGLNLVRRGHTTWW